MVLATEMVTEVVAQIPLAVAAPMVLLVGIARTADIGAGGLFIASALIVLPLVGVVGTSILSGISALAAAAPPTTAAWLDDTVRATLASPAPSPAA